MIEQCSGERMVAEIPEYGGQSRYSRYEECDLKARCKHYMRPDETRQTPAMRMPAEKPCPHYVEWRPARTPRQIAMAVAVHDQCGYEVLSSDIETLLAAWRDECVEASKPEAPESVLPPLKNRESEVLSQNCDYAHEACDKNGENPINWADADMFFRAGYDHARALLTRTPRAESDAADGIDWKHEFEIAGHAHLIQKERAESAEAERDRLLDTVKVLEAMGNPTKELWEQDRAGVIAERDRLRSALAERPPKAYYEGLLSDKDSAVTLLREENEALRAKYNELIEWVKRQADAIRAKGGES